MTTAIRRVTTPAGDPAWLVTNYDDVKALLSDPRLGRWHADPERAPRAFQSVIIGGPISYPLMEDSGHRRFRLLVAPVFSARRMASLRPLIADVIKDLLDAMAHQARPVDLNEAVSFPLATLVICELLGVPYADREDFHHWAEDIANWVDAARSQAAVKHLRDYMRVMVDRKQAEPDDDAISDMVAAVAVQPELTADDIALISTFLLFGGLETTVDAIGRGALLLLTHHEQADALRHDPALAVPAVEEILRLFRPSESEQGVLRYANTDFAFGGVNIKTGELVVLGTGAANLAERLFPEPHQFDVRRTPNPHLAFGHGPHFCVGAALARIELQMLFPALLSRFPTLRLAVPVESLEKRDDGGVAEVPVTW